MNINDLFEGYLSGNYAPLYHNTNMMAAIDILKTNKIRADKGAKEPRKDILDNKYKKLDLSKYHNFVSLTRNFHFARYGWRTPDVIFVLDQNLLRKNYKIYPFDYFSDLSLLSLWPEPNKIRTEAEEFVVRDIFPLDKYLINILITRSGIDRVKKIILRDTSFVERKRLKNGKMKSFFKKTYSGVNDPTIINNSAFANWLDRDVLFKHPKTKIIP